MHQEEIQGLLAKLAVRRQAALSPLDLSVLAEDLAGYSIEDIEDGLDRLRHRREYEPAFPDLGLIESAIADAGRDRRNAELRAARLAREEAEAQADAQRRRDHPEDYIEVRHVWAEVMSTAKVREIPSAPPPPPKVAHEIRSEAVGKGWIRHTCSCGRRPWDTPAEILICPSDRLVEFRKALEAAMAARDKPRK